MFSLYHPRHASLSGVGACPATWLVHALLYEKSVPHERIELDVAAGHHQSEAFLRFHPEGRLPLLIENRGSADECRLSQPLAILHYLEYRHSQPEFLATAAARAPALEALEDAGQLMALVHALVAELTIDHADPEPLASDPRSRFESRQSFDHALDDWEQRLAESDYVCGQEPSLADFALVTHLRVAERLGHGLRSHPNLDRLCRQMMERESLLATAPTVFNV